MSSFGMHDKLRSSLSSGRGGLGRGKKAVEGCQRIPTLQKLSGTSGNHTRYDADSANTHIKYVSHAKLIRS